MNFFLTYPCFDRFHYFRIVKFFLDNDRYIDTAEPLDISIPLSDSKDNPRAWYVDQPRFEPVRTDHYTGSVKEGGSVNFRDVYFNPHGHGTHTECLGHITKEVHSINKNLQHYFYTATLVSVLPKRVEKNGVVDFIVQSEQISDDYLKNEALIVRTLPNKNNKKSANYSSTNPTFFDVNLADRLIENQVDHLLIDLPSVDREEDGGELVFHHRFWEVPHKPNFKRTITELIFVDNAIPDGEYVLEIQTAPFENDAAPSRPVLYAIKSKKG